MKRLTFYVLLVLAMAFLPSLLLWDSLLLYSDFVHQEIPFILETKRMLVSGAPWWSWNTYLGSDFIGSYAFYTLTSPFVWINCLFPEKWVLYGIAFTFVLKFLCMGWVAMAYLRKMGVSKENSWFGAFLFTFSSYSIGSLYYYHFYEPIIVFVLLLLAIERLLRRERWGMTLVTLASFAVAFINFYFAIGSFIAAFIYVIFRAFSCEINISFKTALKGMLAVAVGVIMCSFLLLPVLNQMLLTTRTDPQSAFDTTALLNLLERFRTLFMPKIVEGTTVFVNPGSGSYSNEACIAVFGLSLCCIYIAKHRDWLTGLAVVLLALYVTPLNGVFTLFTNPLYTRWAYALTLVIVLCTVRVLDEGLKVKKGIFIYSLFASFIVLAYVVNMLLARNILIPNVKTIAVIVLFFIGIAALLMWSRNKLSMRWLKLTVVGCVVVQMWLFLVNLYLINLDTESQSYNTLLNKVEKGCDEVVSRTDFRAQKSFLNYNAGLLRNRASVSGYHSVIMQGVDSLFKTASHNFWANNKLCPNMHQEEFDILLSVKTIYEIDSAFNFDKHYVEHFVPFGFAYDNYITRSEFNEAYNDSTFNLPLLMLANLVVEDNDLPYMDGYLEHGSVCSSYALDSVVNERNRTVVSEFKGDSRGYKAIVVLPQNKVLFFSVPFSQGFTATIDGAETPIYKVQLCMQAIAVPAGKHTIEVKYFPPGLKLGCGISLLGLLLLLLVFYLDNKRTRATDRRP